MTSARARKNLANLSGPLAPPALSTVSIGPLSDWADALPPVRETIIAGDARDTKLPANSADLVVTSPPYYQKRDYEHEEQIGLEATPAGYVSAMMECLAEWRRVLRPSGSVFLNIGDTYAKQSLLGIPGRLETAAVDAGWRVRNRIIWAKAGGMPEPARDRLANRHEYVLHLTPSAKYYYDLVGYAETMGNGANPGDIWQIEPERNMGRHLAPFPSEIVRRAALLAAPPQVCETCGVPRRRVVSRSDQLDPTRPQAKRAMELAKAAGLTPAHIAAIQATGVSDAGKALKIQTGTGRNSQEVQTLAAEAKRVLGGYFREFTFAKKVTEGWTDCGHGTPARGVILDPFMGTGTTLRAANTLGLDAVGVDLVPQAFRAAE